MVHWKYAEAICYYLASSAFKNGVGSIPVASTRSPIWHDLTWHIKAAVNGRATVLQF